MTNISDFVWFQRSCGSMKSVSSDTVTYIEWGTSLIEYTREECSPRCHKLLDHYSTIQRFNIHYTRLRILKKWLKLLIHTVTYNVWGPPLIHTPRCHISVTWLMELAENLKMAACWEKTDGSKVWPCCVIACTNTFDKDNPTSLLPCPQETRITKKTLDIGNQARSMRIMTAVSRNSMICFIEISVF